MDTTHFVTGIDLMPTIMEAVGLPMPPDIDGRSVLPVLFGRAQDNREFAYATFYRIFAKNRYPMRGISSAKYEYIYNFWSGHRTEMAGDATGGLTWDAMNEVA